MNQSDKPFWKRQPTPLDHILNPFQAISNYVELTQEEKDQLEINLIEQRKEATLVTLNEFLTVYDLSDIPQQYRANMYNSLMKARAFEKRYGHKLLYTSVFRSWAHHERVYAKINRDRAVAGFPPVKIPTGSNHLRFLAWDVVPAHGDVKHLHDFTTEEVMTELELWGENKVQTPTWLHLQTVKYGSLS